MPTPIFGLTDWKFSSHVKRTDFWKSTHEKSLQFFKPSMSFFGNLKNSKNIKILSCGTYFLPQKVDHFCRSN